MSLLDSLKQAAVKFVSESDVGQQAVDLAAEALKKIEGTSVEVLGNKDLYRTKVSDPTYARLPGVVRSFVDAEQWHELMYSVKDSVFLVDAGHLRLQPAFKQSIHAFVYQLIHGKKPAAETAVAATALPPPGEESK